MKRICGIDEAGRGALVGPLVVAGVCIDQKEEKILRALGVKDSKLLAPKRREEIFQELVDRRMAFFYSRIEPARIDATSINLLEIQESVSIISALQPHQVFLDVPARGRGIERYCEHIRRELAMPVQILGGNKFDVLYPIVGAASIVAKVMRERAIAQLKTVYGDFGSGYPNERTVRYVKEHYDTMRPIVRMKWRTIK